MRAYSDRRLTMQSAKIDRPLSGCRWKARRAASLGSFGAISPAITSLLADTLPAAIPVDLGSAIRFMLPEQRLKLHLADLA